MNRLESLREAVSLLYNKKNPQRGDWADWLFENHVFLVADEAYSLAQRFGADKELAAAAGMLHDIADAVMSRFDPQHEQKSNEIARDLLVQAGFSADEMSIIVDDAMKYHGCHDGETPASLEGKVMATADAVVHLTSDFYEFTKQQMVAEKGIDGARSWALPKIERDLNNKIFFEEIRSEVEPSYCKVRSMFA